MTTYFSNDNKALLEIRDKDLEPYFQQAFSEQNKYYNTPKAEREEVTYLPFADDFNFSALRSVEETISGANGFVYLEILKETLKETLINGSQKTKQNLFYAFQNSNLSNTKRNIEELASQYSDNLNFGALLDTKNKFFALNVFENNSMIVTNILKNSQDLFTLSENDLEDHQVFSDANELLAGNKIGIKDKISLIKSLSKKSKYTSTTQTFQLLEDYVKTSSTNDNKAENIKEIFNNFHKNNIKISNIDFENVVCSLPESKEMQEIFYEQLKNNRTFSSSYRKIFPAQNSFKKAQYMIELDRIHTALKSKDTKMKTSEIMELIRNREDSINFKEELNHLELEKKLSILEMHNLKDKNKLVLATEVLKKDRNILKKSPQSIEVLLKSIEATKDNPYAEMKAFSKELSTFSAEATEYVAEIAEKTNILKKQQMTRNAFLAEEEKFQTIGNLLNSIGNIYANYEYKNKQSYKSKGYSQADFEQIVSNVLEGKEPQSLEAHKSGLFSGKDTKETINVHLNPELEKFSRETSKLKPFAEELKQYSGNIVKNAQTTNEIFAKSSDAYTNRTNIEREYGSSFTYYLPEYETFLQKFGELNLLEKKDSLTVETQKKEKELKATADYNLQRYLGVTSGEKSGVVNADENAEKAIKNKLDSLKSSLKQKVQEDLSERDVMTKPNPNNSSELPEGKKILPNNNALKKLKEIKSYEKGRSK